MGFRIRKSFKLGPLGRVNLSKSGLSVSMGVRGARVNVGPKGTRMTVGLPVTGLSYSTKLGGSTQRAASAAPQLMQASNMANAPPSNMVPNRASPSNAGTGCLKFFAGLFSIGMFWGIASSSFIAAVVFAVVVITSWIFISRTIKKGRELRDRQLRQDEIRRFEAHQAEQQRVYAEQQAYQQWQYAEQQRIAALETAERQRQMEAYQAEQARLERERQAEQTRLERERQAEQARIDQERHAEQERIKRERWDGFVSKYGEALAHRIWAGRPWVGCEYGMLIDMLGPPVDIDERVLKTKTKHTYKYRPTGANRYALRVYLDDGIVTGWEDKSD